MVGSIIRQGKDKFVPRRAYGDYALPANKRKKRWKRQLDSSKTTKRSPSMPEIK